jgi:drug/metabolite transporter (DMT)-like permease
MTPPSIEHRQALAGLLLANLFWALSFPVIKAMAHEQMQLLPASGNWFITAMTVASRFLMATAVLVLVMRRELAGITRREVRQGCLLGLALGLGLLFQVDGLQFTEASTSAFLTQFYAVMIPVAIALRLRRAPPKVVWLCVALVLAGVAILGRFDFRALQFGRGELETLVSSVFFMLQIFVLADDRYVGNRVLPVTVVMFGLMAAGFTVLALATAPTPADFIVPWSSGSWLLFAVLLTLFSTLGAFLLQNRWQPKITATEAGLIYCFEPVFASAMALFLPGWFSAWAGFDYADETVTWQLVAGGGLITLANVWLQLKPQAKTGR